MGMTIWVNARYGKQFKADQEDHSAIFDLVEELDALSEKLRVTPISTFFDETDVRYNMGELPESDEGWSADAAKWHDAKDGLATIVALQCHVRDNHSAIDPKAEGWSAADLLSELEDCRAKLEALAQAKRPFHFLVVM